MSFRITAVVLLTTGPATWASTACVGRPAAAEEGGSVHVDSDQEEVVWVDDFGSMHPRWEWDYNSGTGYKRLTELDGQTVLEAGITEESTSAVYSDCSLLTHFVPVGEITVEARIKFSDNNGLAGPGRGSRGFGFWDGVGDNVAWFLSLSPESAPGLQGFKAQVRVDGGEIRAGDLSVDLTKWHVYRIELLESGTRFLIDGLEVAWLRERPSRLQRLSLWLDNYAVEPDLSTRYLDLERNEIMWVDWVRRVK